MDRTDEISTHLTSLKLSLLASAILLASCSSNNNDSSSSYYLAPEPVSSGTSVAGVDIASGKLTQGDSDLSSFSRLFSSQGSGSKSLGGWNHNYASQLDGKGTSYENWKGLKTAKFAEAEKACTTGWGKIKASAYNGKLVDAQPIFHQGLCDLYLDSKIVASLPVHYEGENPYPLHLLTRPDGSTVTFFKDSNGESSTGESWQTITRTPLSLKKVGDNWQITTLNDSIETYNKEGQLTSITNSSGQTTKLSYKNSKLVKVVGHFGKALEFSYKNDKLDKAKGVDGTVYYAYDNNGKLITVTKVDGTKTTYNYTAGNLSSVVDATGNTIASYTYDTLGRVTQSEGASGSNAKAISYTTDSVSIKDANATDPAIDTYQFVVSHGVMKVVSITDTDDKKQTFEYDANGYPSKVTAKNGSITTTTYNKRGLLVSRTVSAGTKNARTTLTEWHPNLRKATKQLEPGKVTFSEYNKAGLLSQRIQGTVTPAYKQLAGNALTKLKVLNKSLLKSDGIRTQSFEYTENGQSKARTAANSAKTEFSYDKKGNRSSTKNALGQINKTLEFDATGRALKIQDANGTTTTSVYDKAGRLISTISNNQTTSYEYDSVGKQTKVTYPDGSTTQNKYDQADNLTKIIDQDGNTTENSFDKNGNQTANKVVDKDGNILLSSQSKYNNKNQLVKSTDADGNETQYTYDENGNQVKITDTKGNETNNEYDTENRLVKTIDAIGGETSYAYDINGNRTKVIAPNGATTSFEYDNFNQLTKEISPDRGTTTYLYDVSGNQISKTDANGNTKTTSYDLLNRKTGEAWENHPDLTVAYAYDSCRVGSLCKTTDKSGSTTLSYDSEGNITQKDSNIEGTTLSLKYSYDDNDKLQSVTYPSGKVISYNYTTDKINGISIDGNTLISDISYNGANQLTGWKWNDGTAYTKSYDSNGRLKTFPLGNKTRTLTYDKLGNITGWNDSGSEHYKHFAYDALSRLKSFKKKKFINNADDDVLQSQIFSYDANGNRINLKEGIEDLPTETIYSILEESNRLAKVGGISYQYDANGNIIDDGEHTYSYDARNRLTDVDGENNYLFNANNMRVKKDTAESTILYGWDNGRIFAEYGASGSSIQETVYFGSTPIAVLKNEQTYKVFADQIDTPRVITDSLNNTLWVWESKPFGESLPNEDVDDNNENLSYNLRFPGQYYDGETGKHYNFNRDYNPLTGRYVQSDPIGLQGGTNSFIYVEGSPLTNSDSSGLMTEVYDSSLTVQHKRIIFYALQTVRAKSGISRVVNYFNLFRYNIRANILNNGRGHRILFQNRRMYTNVTTGGRRTAATGLTSKSGTKIDVGSIHNNAFLLAGAIIHEIGHYANKNYTTGWWLWKRQVNPSISSVISLTPSQTPNPKDPIYGYAAEKAMFGRIIMK